MQTIQIPQEFIDAIADAVVERLQGKVSPAAGQTTLDLKEPETTMTLEEFRERLAKLAATRTVEQFGPVLKKYGGSASKIDPANYQKVLEQVEAL